MNISDWIQALCALATLILAICIAVQQTKIKTLTDVVNSLNNQAKTSQQLLEFEMRSRLNNVQPNFITFVNKYNINHFVFSFKNIGQRARSIKFEAIDNMATLNINNPGNKVIPTGDIVEGNYTLSNVKAKYSFKILFEDNNGTHFFQMVTGTLDKRLYINLPEKI
jgi:cell division protein ZapA (FtsZ GTPase activity inhibitor)